MSRRINQRYQDRIDLLLTVQAFIAALASSAIFSPDVPGWLVWVLGASQAALAVALFQTKKRLPSGQAPRDAEPPDVPEPL